MVKSGLIKNRLRIQKRHLRLLGILVIDKTKVHGSEISEMLIIL